MSFCSDIKLIKKTRKEHKCVYCNRIIPIGKSAESWFYADGGDSCCCYACIPCSDSKLINKDDYLEYDEIYGELHDFLYDNIYGFNTCSICGDRHDNYEWTENGDIEFECEYCKHKWVVPYGWE